MIDKINLMSLTKDDLFRFIERLHLPEYRARQLMDWIYKKYASDIDEITEFSKDLRARLKELAFIGGLRLVKKILSSDGTEKYLFSLVDGNTIESVLIPDEDRLTLCVSSQVGCGLGCRFCLTGRAGFTRNLEAYEIVDQIIAANRSISPKKVTNIVFMGMGEPLMNFDNVVDTLWRISQLIGISRRKITVSTSGIVPKILLLPGKAPDVNLAVSLNAADNETRNRLMPINKKYPLETLIAACRKYPLRPGRRITFEYVMVEGINDSADDARKLTRLLKGIHCKINLIPFNTFPECDFKRPSEETLLAFQKILLKNTIRALIRESKGKDIFAACGQLRAGHTE